MDWKGPMVFNPPLQGLSRLFFAALLIFILLYPTSAVSAPISMETSLGFDGVFSLNTWTPLNVVIENTGRTFSGRLEVLVTTGSEFRGDVQDTIYSREVELPTRSKKKYAFTILMYIR